MPDTLTFADLKALGKPIVLAPKNEVTRVVHLYLEKYSIPVLGYSDSIATDDDCLKAPDIPPGTISLIFSNNHWQAIQQRLAHTETYIVCAIDGGYRFVEAAGFDAYTNEQQCIHNNTIAQRTFWQNHIETYLDQGCDIERYGYTWGDPEAADDPLGNYRWVLHKMLSWLDDDSTLLDLGSMSGKWLKYFLSAKKLVCVDINTAFIDVIRQRYAAHIDKFSFYQTTGNELHGIANRSIDIVFCMDTLVRVEKEFIADYFTEMERVVKDDGKLIIHLPCTDRKACTSRQFTHLSRPEITEICSRLKRKYVILDNVLVHGVLVIAE